MSIAVLIGLLVALWIFVSAATKAAKRKELLAKYGDPSVVDMIMRRVVWEGMTQEQLIDSRGRPAARDEKVYKTKVVHVYKYNQDGRRRYQTRVTVENGYVVGWTQR
jgi:hypothetical protein